MIVIQGSPNEFIDKFTIRLEEQLVEHRDAEVTNEVLLRWSAEELAKLIVEEDDMAGADEDSETDDPWWDA